MDSEYVDFRWPILYTAPVIELVYSSMTQQVIILFYIPSFPSASTLPTYILPIDLISLETQVRGRPHVTCYLYVAVAFRRVNFPSGNSPHKLFLLTLIYLTVNPVRNHLPPDNLGDVIPLCLLLPWQHG